MNRELGPKSDENNLHDFVSFVRQLDFYFSLLLEISMSFWQQFFYRRAFM